MATSIFRSIHGFAAARSRAAPSIAFKPFIAVIMRAPRSPTGRSGVIDRVLVDSNARSSWVPIRDGVRQGGEASDRPLAVGSAFKLHVLDTFRLAVVGGTLARDEVVILEEWHRS